MTEVETRAGDVSGNRADDADALYVLGTRYSIGRDVEQDLIAAHKWFNLAAMMGHDEARIARAELAREMSAAGIADAQRQARAWLWGRANPGAEDAAAGAKPAVPFSKDKAPTGEPAAQWQGNRSLCA